MKPHTLRLPMVAGALAVASLLSACAPLLIGGAVVGGSMVAIDRRTAGTQIEDQSIELKAMTRVRETLGDRGHVNATSYNRIVLLTGEVASDADRAAIEKEIAAIEGVRSTVNELSVMGATSLSARSNDALLTTKVKASFVDAKDLHASAIKVVSERGTVYLMGRVTEREATRATDITRSISGVQRVVRLFEILTEEELANLQPRQQPQPQAK